MEGHRDFLFLNVAVLRWSQCVTFNIWAIAGIQNILTDTHHDIVGAFVAKAPHSHWPTTELLLKISWSHEWTRFCDLVRMLMFRHVCPFVVRRKLKLCGNTSFVFKVLLVILSILSFDFSFSIGLSFPYRSLVGFEWIWGGCPAQGEHNWQLIHKCAPARGTARHTVALSVAQQYD